MPKVVPRIVPRFVNSRPFRFMLGFAAGLMLSAALARADVARADSIPASASKFSLRLDPSGISAAEKAPLEAFVASVEQLIPDGMKAGIGRGIRVRFSKMGGDMTQLAVPACEGGPTTEADKAPADEKADPSQIKADDQAKMELLGHDSYGGRASVVDINALFKQEILAGPTGTRTYPCGHHDMYRLAEATLIHELAHVYDARLGKQQSTKDKYFQNLMGFTNQRSWKTLFLIPFLRPKNRMALRSPDPYEFKNIRETFAVNMEYFVLDPEFGCRRPAVDSYYRQLLGITSAPSCKLDTTIYLNSDNPTLNLKAPLDLDPSRIYDVHYLLASKSSQFMSRWGHAMFRIIVCAPWRKTVGPECLQDVQYHVVLSYRADVSDLILSYTKGLDGGYPSQLYVLPLTDVLTEYNKLQLRDLVSLPLNLTTDQKTQFIYRTLEQYWEYQGRYYFLTNNCAEEALTLLKGVVPDRKVQKLHDLTPLGLEGDLNKLGMIDEGLVKNQQTAIQQGYFFASKKPVLDNAFTVIDSVLGGGLEKDGIESSGDYMAKTSADQRRQYFNAAIQAADPNDRVKTAAYFYLLESYISSFDEQSIDKKVAGAVEKLSSHPSDDSSDGGINDGLVRTMEAIQPWNQLISGYGVPQPADFDTSIAKNQNGEIAAAYKKFQDWMALNFQDDIAEFKKIQVNLDTFVKTITAGAPKLEPLTQASPTPQNQNPS